MLTRQQKTATNETPREAMSRLPVGSNQTEFQDALVPYIPQLRRYAQGLTQDPEAADDLVQDALLRAMDKRHLWKAGGNMRAWLYRILHNTFVNNQRRARVRRTESVDDHEAQMGTAARQHDGVVLRSLETALHRLPPAHREVVMLVGVEGLSYEEAAGIIGCPVGTIRSRLSRARETLKQHLDGSEAGKTHSLRKLAA